MQQGCHKCHEKHVEWAGFYAQKEHEDGTIGQKPNTTFMFGPMIDSPYAHSDTYFTTLKHLKKCLTAFRMDYIHVTVDMQLYQVMCMIKWSDQKNMDKSCTSPRDYACSNKFFGAIRTLMKSSGLEEIINAEFGCVESISNGRAWNKAIRAHHLTLFVQLKIVIGNAPKSGDI